MSKYRKRPVVIDAVQWKHAHVIPPAPDSLLRECGKRWELKTLEGWYKLTVGDFIITGVKGEFYPCKPDIFEMTYEAVDSDA